jgi:hypothetical protein
MRARMGELGKAQGIHAWRSSRIDTKVEDAIGLHGDGDRRQARGSGKYWQRGARKPPLSVDLQPLYLNNKPTWKICFADNINSAC